MRAIDRLRRDHTILRSKLDVLESALNMGPQAWYVLRDVCFTLSRQLQDHIKREEELVVLCRRAMIPPPDGGSGALPSPQSGLASAHPSGGGMNPKVLAEVSVEHKDEPEHLRTINRLFVEEHTHTLDRIRPALTGVIQGLRRHMAEEEAELFPVLERTLADQEAIIMGASTASLLDETMTVNRIVSQFPRTKPVFEQLFINVPMEGCTCLDEVAWRHGLDARELLAKLEDVMDSCQCRAPDHDRRLEPEHAQPAEAS